MRNQMKTISELDQTVSDVRFQVHEIKALLINAIDYAEKNNKTKLTEALQEALGIAKDVTG